MYCINCGVKLSDTERQCPLCATRVFHPELQRPEVQPPYPSDKMPPPHTRSKGPLVIVTALFLLPVLIVLLCDLQLYGGVTWSGYVMGGIGVAYVLFVLPLWFYKPNPVIFVACDFVAVGAYLLYICLATGGNWFLSFAFPVTGGVGLIVTAVVTLLRYTHGGELYIFGGAFILLGLFMLPVEILANVTFGVEKFFGWSLYPLVTLVLLGGTLIFLAINRAARESMERRLFL